MPANLTAVGIALATETTCTRHEYTKKLDDRMIMTATGGHGASASINPTIDFSFSGRGDLPAAAALGIIGGGTPADPDNDDITGGISIISNSSYTEKNDDYQEWSYSGKNFPCAS